MNKNFSFSIDKNMFKRGFICFIIMLTGTFIFRSISSFLPSIIEIKMENVFPPVFGLYFGAAGALACACGEICASIMQGQIEPGLLFIKFVSYFAYGYIPYKLWYTFNIKEKCEIPNLDDIGGILRYAYIVFIDSASMMFISKLSFHIITNDKINLKMIFIEFFNNYNFQCIIGIIVLIIFSTTEIRPHIPKTKSNLLKNFHYEYIVYAIGIFSLCGMILLKNDSVNNGKYISIIMLLLSYGCLVMFLASPIVNKDNAVEISKIRGAFSIKGKVTIGLLVFVIVLIFLLYFLGYISLKNYLDAERDSQVYLAISLVSYFVFALAIIALKYVENTITVPLQILFNVVTTFSKSENEKIDVEELKETCEGIKTGDEIEELSIAFCKMMSDIQEYVKNIKEASLEKEKVEAELMAATKIQSSLLPNIFPAFPQRDDFEIFANMRPAKGISGDFYDFYLFGDKLAFVIADVSGKGVPAALFMMTAKSVIKNAFASSSDIREVVRRVNNELCENNEALMFVTAFLGIINLKEGILTYVNAGHTPPLLKHDFGKFEYINIKNNCILGIIPNADFEKQEIELRKNDMLFAYTDGVTEAMNSFGNLYGMEKLKEVLNKESMKYIDIYGMIPMVRKDIDKFCKGEKQTDDITMLTFKYLKKKK